VIGRDPESIKQRALKGVGGWEDAGVQHRTKGPMSAGGEKGGPLRVREDQQAQMACKNEKTQKVEGARKAFGRGNAGSNRARIATKPVAECFAEFLKRSQAGGDGEG